MNFLRKLFRSTGKYLAAALLLAAPVSGAHAATIVYDLATDWSDTSNPNGAWSYNVGGAPLTAQQAVYPLPGPSQPAWALATGGPDHIPVLFKSVSNLTATTGGGFDYNVGDVGLHTWDPFNGISTSAPVAMTWTAQSNSIVDIGGHVWHAHLTGDRRAVDWSVLVDGVVVTAGLIERDDGTTSASRFDIAGGTGGASVLDNISLSAGQVVEIRFETSSAFGSPFGSFVGVDFTVTATDIPAPGALPILVGAVFCLGIAARRRRL